MSSLPCARVAWFRVRENGSEVKTYSMKKTILVTFAAVALTTQAGLAQTTVHMWEDPRGWWGNHFVYGPTMPNKFTANEFSVDAFASFWAAERKIGDLFETNIRDGKWGGGLGFNYFLTPYVGIGADANVPDNGGNFFDSVAGSLILRLPSETTGLAPYVFGGGGRLTDRVWEWTAHAGVGLEFRVNPITGFFADGRYMWADEASDSLLLRAGVRFIF